MENKEINFIIWCIFGCIFIFLALYSCFCRKPMKFWSNIKVFEVSDVKKYNHAVSKLFFIFGIIMIAFGIPLLTAQNSVWLLFSIIGVMIESIVVMAVYSLVIEKKYKKS